MKRTRRSQRIEREARDRLSDMPDCVLLNIMKFIKVKEAVRTCILSKRWKDVWKRLTNLTLDSSDFSRLHCFNKFVSSFISRRDDSTSLHNLDLKHEGCIGPRLLNRVMTYAASHDVQQMIIRVDLSVEKAFELSSSVFCCHSLTLLKLSFWCRVTSGNKIKLPKSLELSALKSLHIEGVTYSTSDDGYAEPFSKCNMLNTLVIRDCYLHSDVKVLCISNSKPFSLTIINDFCWHGKAYEIMLTTPNLNLLTIKSDLLHQLSSACNITCLEEVNIDLFGNEEFPKDGLVINRWLQVLVNAKEMTLSWGAFLKLNALLYHDSVSTQLPCFVRLKSLKLKIESSSEISDEGVSRTVKYSLQNSPLTRVNIIRFERKSDINAT